MRVSSSLYRKEQRDERERENTRASEDTRFPRNNVKRRVNGCKREGWASGRDCVKSS